MRPLRGTSIRAYFLRESRHDTNLNLPMTGIRRRDVLTGTALLLVGPARGNIVSGQLPWHPEADARPQPVMPGPWVFFSEREALVMGAIADRIIPADPQTLGGK